MAQAHSACSDSPGYGVNTLAIRAPIRHLIGAEDTKAPLNDGAIAKLLGEQGMIVARRTVAKYREALQIPPVSLRNEA